MKLPKFFIKQNLLNNIFLKFSLFLPVVKFVVKGKSMEPILKEGEQIFANKTAYIMRKPKTGDIVVVKLRNNYIIKKIEKAQKNKYFIVGENTKESTDSREFGWVEKKDIFGKVII